MLHHVLHLGVSDDDWDEAVRHLAAQLDPEETPQLALTAARLRAERRRLEASWTEPTVNDRLSAAFLALADDRVLALEGAGITREDGFHVCRERAGPGARGAAWFDQQQQGHGAAGRGLWIAYAAFDGAADEEIGALVFAALRAAGVEAEWTGAAADAIRVPPFPWRRRQLNGTPDRPGIR